LGVSMKAAAESQVTLAKLSTTYENVGCRKPGASDELTPPKRPPTNGQSSDDVATPTQNCSPLRPFGARRRLPPPRSSAFPVNRWRKHQTSSSETTVVTQGVGIATRAAAAPPDSRAGAQPDRHVTGRSRLRLAEGS
jgi:hypothetical protein